MSDPDIQADIERLNERWSENAGKTFPPGSPEAVSAGCECPIYDNSHGAGINGLGRQWRISSACPLHGMRGYPPDSST